MSLHRDLKFELINLSLSLNKKEFDQITNIAEIRRNINSLFISQEHSEFFTTNDIYTLQNIYISFKGLNFTDDIIKKFILDKINVIVSINEALQGNADYQNTYGFCLLNGIGVTKDINKGKKYLTLSAQNGDAKGQYHLAMHLKESDKENYLKWLKKSAAQKNASANYELGKLHLENYNLAKAIDAFEIAKLQEPDALFYLYQLNDDDYPKNTHFLDAAIKQEVDDAFVEYGLNLLFDKKFNRALTYFTNIIDRNIGRVNYYLGITHEELLKTFQSRSAIKQLEFEKEHSKKAFEHYTEAAKWGDPNAQFKLGKIYEFGFLKVKINLKLSRDYYTAAYKEFSRISKKPSDHDYINALRKLAYMHENGHGKKTDFQIAKKYYQLIAARLPKSIANNLKEIDQKIEIENNKKKSNEIINKSEEIQQISENLSKIELSSDSENKNLDNQIIIETFGLSNQKKKPTHISTKKASNIDNNADKIIAKETHTESFPSDLENILNRINKTENFEFIEFPDDDENSKESNNNSYLLDFSDLSQKNENQDLFDTKNTIKTSNEDLLVKKFQEAKEHFSYKKYHLAYDIYKEILNLEGIDLSTKIKTYVCLGECFAMLAQESPSNEKGFYFKKSKNSFHKAFNLIISNIENIQTTNDNSFEYLNWYNLIRKSTNEIEYQETFNAYQETIEAKNLSLSSLKENEENLSQEKKSKKNKNSQNTHGYVKKMLRSPETKNFITYNIPLDINDNDLEVLNILLKKHKIEIFGGYILDKLMDRQSYNIDLKTNSSLENILELFPQAEKINADCPFIKIKDGNTIIRVFNYDTSSHRKSNRNDPFTRDYTITGMSYNLTTHEIEDYVGGMADFNKKLIRVIGDNPNVKFQQDPTLILGALKLKAKTGFKFTDNIETAIHAHKKLLIRDLPRAVLTFFISQEFIRDYCFKFFKLLCEYQIFDLVLPATAQGLVSDALFQKIVEVSLTEFELFAEKQQPASPELVLAIFLWHSLIQESFLLNLTFPLTQENFNTAMDETLKKQKKLLSLPERSCQKIKTIWEKVGLETRILYPQQKLPVKNFDFDDLNAETFIRLYRKAYHFYLQEHPQSVITPLPSYFTITSEKIINSSHERGYLFLFFDSNRTASQYINNEDYALHANCQNNSY